jgi:hypothetical protein
MAPKKQTLTPRETGTTVRTSGENPPSTNPDGDPVAGATGTTEATVVQKHTPVIEHIIFLCDFPDDSTMVKIIDQRMWTKLFHVTTIGLDEIKDFQTVRNDGVTFEAKSMTIHRRMFKCFLLYYKRKSRELFSPLDENDVMRITRTEFYEYCGSDDYALDLESGGVNPNARGNVN